MTDSFGIQLINLINSLVKLGVSGEFTNPHACKVWIWSLNTINATLPLALELYNLALIVNSKSLKNEPYLIISFKSTYLIVPLVFELNRGLTP